MQLKASITESNEKTHIHRMNMLFDFVEKITERNDE